MQQQDQPAWTSIDPVSDISFVAEPGNCTIRMLYKGEQCDRMYIYTPPFVTCFPKLNVSSDGVTRPEDLKRLSIELDLSMKGAGETQAQFRAWMDAMDDRLAQFVHANQRLVGKAGLPMAAVKHMQKRQFRERVSTKTGKQYADSMSLRAKAVNFCGTKTNRSHTRNTLPVVLDGFEGATRVVYCNDGSDAADGCVQYNDMVSACIRSDGPYCNPGQYFGLGWTLISLRNYGQPTQLEPPPPMTDFPNLGSAAEFPTLNSSM